MSTLNNSFLQKFQQNVVLGSASPRRRELLGQLVPDFEILVSDVDEEALTTSDPWETAEGLALAKAQAVAKLRPDALVIGGDTVVAHQDRQLAKPLDGEEAVAMLLSLSNQTHRVITGVALVWPGGSESWHDTSEVTFRELSRDEVERYVATGEPMDKAGAYAIQGGAAGFVEKLEGSLTNVIGLPLEGLRERLARRQETP